MIAKANENMLDTLNKNQDDDQPMPPSGGGSTSPDIHAEVKLENKDTLILDAACAPAYFRYIQDVYLLNETREKLVAIEHKSQTAGQFLDHTFGTFSPNFSGFPPKSCKELKS